MRQVTKSQKALTQIVLDHPFVASILLRHPIKDRDDIKTLAIDKRGQIYQNPKFIESLTVPEIVWAYAHEVFHRIGQHADRMGGRNPSKWNYATDAWINDTISEAGIGTPIKNTVHMDGARAKHEERIYDELPDDPPPDNPKPGNDGDDGDDGQPNGPTNQPYDGDQPNDGIGDDLLDEGPPITESERQQLKAQIKLEVAEAAQAAKVRGKLPGVLQKFAETVIDSRLPWYDVLEQYMSEKAQNDYSWLRPNKRHQDVYLPSMRDESNLGDVVIQVDISGSVSRQEIRHYNGHMQRIMSQCRPAKVHVIYTDTQVQMHETFERDDDVQINYHSGGGTDMCAGIDYIREQGIEPAVFITLTDGFTDFPDSVDVPTIWCISSNIKAPDHSGMTIHFEMTN
jgi:predicted metal-dependent peptidase